MTYVDRPDAIPTTLLAQTLARYVDPAAQIERIEYVDLSSGLSGAPVRRYTIAYAASSGGNASTSLVTKLVERREWLTLRHLNAQRQPNIPFAHALDEVRGEQVLICMQDVGDTTRPTSLDPISEAELAREAEGLAAIHIANAGNTAALDWLPIVDREYIEDMIFQRTWRPAWETAIANREFVDTFAADIPRVEAAAATIAGDMADMLADAGARTLIHTDLNPSNVLVQAGTPYFIDWQSAMRGPLYLDLPHHHCTLAQAEHYRRARAAREHPIAAPEFAERYRVAARYIGLRYMWWTLEYWLGDPTQTAWVRHYLGLVTGAGIG